MDKNTDIKLQIADEYEQIRNMNRLKTQQIKSKILEEIPQIQEIETRLSNILKELLSSAISHAEDSNTNAEKLKNEVSALLKQKSHLLALHGYEQHALSDIYDCELCKDTGVVEGKLCKCYQKKLIDKLFRSSEMHEKLKHDNFDHFDYGLFSNQIQTPGSSSDDLSARISPRQNIEEIRYFAQEFIDRFEDIESKNLYFFGKSGLGKTFMSSCIAREILLKQYDVVYKTFYEIMDIARAYKYDNNRFDSKKTSAAEKHDLLLKTDLLIIDDLDANSVNAFTLSELFHIINTRILNYKKMIISSNISAKDLHYALDERIASRIHGNFIELEFIGDDLRLN